MLRTILIGYRQKKRNSLICQRKTPSVGVSAFLFIAFMTCTIKRAPLIFHTNMSKFTDCTRGLMCLSICCKYMLILSRTNNKKKKKKQEKENINRGQEAEIGLDGAKNADLNCRRMSYTVMN